MQLVSKIILFVAACSTTLWFSLSVKAQRLDPATGLRAPTKEAEVNSATGLPTASPGTIHLDPKTGLPMGLTLNDLGQHTFPAVAFSQSLTLLPQVEELIEKYRYEDALQLLLDNHQQFKLNDPLAETLLPEWIELNRRCPRAKEALIGIRDQYQNEFYAGRGYQLLFGELSAINSRLQQDDSTYALFQFIRKQDRKLAEQCFSIFAPQLIKRGEFDLCLSYVGDAKENFDSIRGSYDWALVHQHHADLLKRQSDQQLAQVNQQLGLTNHGQPLSRQNYYLPPPVPVDRVPGARKFTEDSFVNGTRQLIEILVGAGRKSEAEDIQSKAVAILDDPRLKSAVGDATQQVQKLSPHNP
jgi:hypothetical protein